MHKVYHVFRFSLEAFSQLRVLGRDANRTGIQVADSHHDTTHGYQRRCGKSEFFRAQKRRNGYVPSAHQLSVRLYHYPVSQTVFLQCLVCFCQSQFPGKSCIVNGTFRCCSRTAVIAGNQNHLRTRLGHACRHGSHACLRNQFYGNPGIFVGIFQIID